MPDSVAQTKIDRISGVRVVALRVAPPAAATTAERLHLAPTLRMALGEPESCWIGPGNWLLMSANRSAQDLIGQCNEALNGVVHIAVDCSAAWSGFLLSGKEARGLLASGTGLDLRFGKFEKGHAAVTSIARIPVLIIALERNELELWVDTALAPSLHDWLNHTAELGRRISGEYGNAFTGDE